MASPISIEVALELIHEHPAHLPIAMQTLDGNQSDKTTMQASVSQHSAQLRHVGIGLLVKDSAGYTSQAIKAHEEANLKWITRLPATLSEAKTLLETTDPYRMQPLVEGYKYLEVRCDYAGVAQPLAHRPRGVPIKVRNGACAN